MNVIVPSQLYADAVNASPYLSAVIVHFKGGAPSATEPDRVVYPEAGTVPPHTPPARALLADGYSWDSIEPVVRQVPSLELVQTLAQGVDPLRGIPEHIAVSNGRGAHGAATAELGVLLLLALQRRLPDFLAAQAAGRWEPGPAPKGLAGARVLIVGAGDLAHEFARRVSGFGAVCSLVGRTARDGVHATSELPALLPAADAVVLTVSYNSTTHHLADAAFLSRLRDGAILVNIARGPVVDTDALLAELTAGRLRAGLDVTDPEPLPAGHPLWRAPGVIITPHAGFVTEGAGPRGLDVAVAQLEQLAQGRRPDNVVPRADLV